MEIVPGMFFVNLSNADIQFMVGALPTTIYVELIDKYKFARVALSKNSETFVVHVVVLETLEPTIYPSQAYLLAASQQNKASTKILPNIFLPVLAIELPKNTGVNKYVINPIKGK